MACVWSGEAGWTCTGWTGWVTWSTMLSERRWENRLHINMKVVVGRRLIFYLRHIQFPFTLPLVQLHFLLLWCRSVPTTAVADRETSLMSCIPPPLHPLCFAARGRSGPGGVWRGSTQNQGLWRQRSITQRGHGGERDVDQHVPLWYQTRSLLLETSRRNLICRLFYVSNKNS